MTDKTHHPLNFSPFATNVLDCVGRADLLTRDGRAVRIENHVRGFEIYLDGKLECETPINTSASYFLNSLEVGVLA